MPAEPGNPLGKPRGSLNSPIVATTMAILLGSYCIASLRSARDTSSTNPNANANANSNAGSGERSDSSTAPQPAFSFSFREKQQPRKTEQPAWMQEAIEASREEGKKRAGGK